MTAWIHDEIEKIAAANVLELATARRDGTLRRPVPVWVVREGDDLYVRSWRGRTGTWFRHTEQTHVGHISAGGVEKNVRFVEADASVNDALDAAYRAKYQRSAASYVPPMLSPDARATTLKLVPQTPNERNTQ